MDDSRWRLVVYGLALLVFGLQLAGGFLPPAVASIASLFGPGSESLLWTRTLFVMAPWGLLAIAALCAAWLHLRQRVALPGSWLGRAGFWLAALGLAGCVGSLAYGVLVAGYGANAVFLVLAMPYALAEATLRIGIVLVEIARIAAGTDQGYAWGRRIDTA